MLSVGFIFSLASGLALPFHFVLFGTVADITVYHSLSTSEIANTTVSMLARSFAQSFNISCEQLLNQHPTLIVQSTGNLSMIHCMLDSHRTSESVIKMACDPTKQIKLQVEVISFYYLILATAFLVTSFWGILLLDMNAYRQTQRIREALYHSILHQEIGWFDVGSAKELSGRMIE